LFLTENLTFEHLIPLTDTNPMQILVCEKEDVLLTALEFRMNKHQFKTLRAHNAEEALDLLASANPDFLVTDSDAGSLSGLELIRKAHQMKPDLPIILISSMDHDDEVLEALKVGARDFITKPFNPVELVLRIRKIFQETKVS